MSTPKPSVGGVAHYVARGSADGVFPPACRAATITQAGAWVDEPGGIGVDNPRAFQDPERPDVRLRVRTERWDPEAVHLHVMNPTGTFTHGPMVHDEGVAAAVGDECPNASTHGAPFRYCSCGWREATTLCTGLDHTPGSWHWPARVDEDTARSAARGQRSMDRR